MKKDVYLVKKRRDGAEADVGCTKCKADSTCGDDCECRYVIILSYLMSVMACFCCVKCGCCYILSVELLHVVHCSHNSVVSSIERTVQ